MVVVIARSVSVDYGIVSKMIEISCEGSMTEAVHPPRSNHHHHSSLYSSSHLPDCLLHPMMIRVAIDPPYLR